MKQLLFLVALFSSSGVWIKAEPVVSIPQVGKGATVRIITHIPNDIRNRYEVVVWGDEDGELGRSEHTLNENDIPTQQFYLEHLDEGKYQVVLVVYRTDKQLRAEARFQVGQ